MEPTWPATTTTGPAEPPTTYRPEGDLAKGGRVGREAVAAGTGPGRGGTRRRAGSAARGRGRPPPGAGRPVRRAGTRARPAGEPAHRPSGPRARPGPGPPA